MLQILVDDTRTDKNTCHSYLTTYEKLLCKKKESAKNILEIGICKGGSIQLWHDYFTNANIYAMDIMHINDVYDKIKNNDRISLMTSTNAYDEKVIKENFIDNNIKFDMILDDGPHTLESMCFTAKHYSQLLTDDGILIIEDVQSMDWLKDIFESFTKELLTKVEFIDLRSNKNQYDDILIILDKSKELCVLETLVDNIRTDKNTWHSYLKTYDATLTKIKDTATNILEIGICKGVSIKLWYDYFTNANIYAIDIIHINEIYDEIRNKDRISLMTSTNAYDEKVIKEKFIDNNIKFNMILDDGPHTFESMCFTAKHYSQLLTDDGILIIEDVQNMDWVTEIIISFPANVRDKIKIVDLRHIKNRYDDILIILDKSN